MRNLFAVSSEGDPGWYFWCLRVFGFVVLSYHAEEWDDSYYSALSLKLPLGFEFQIKRTSRKK